MNFWQSSWSTGLQAPLSPLCASTKRTSKVILKTEWTTSMWLSVHNVKLQLYICIISHYWLSSLSCFRTGIFVPTGLAAFQNELMHCPQSWAQIRSRNIYSYTSFMSRGGHFAAFEEPKLLADDILQFVKKVEKPWAHTCILTKCKWASLSLFDFILYWGHAHFHDSIKYFSVFGLISLQQLCCREIN